MICTAITFTILSFQPIILYIVLGVTAFLGNDCIINIQTGDARN